MSYNKLSLYSYTGIYPTDLIANGGLIGDTLFFAISGYCLYNVRQPFARWYGRRLWRVFLPVWIGTAIFLVLGGYDFSSMSLTQWFFYPTYYHFVASIVLLYIPFYFVVRPAPLFPCLHHVIVKEKIPLLMGLISIVMLLVYVLWYDKSYYHIDTVREPFIRFLFFLSMLLGAYFRHNDYKFRNQFGLRDLVGLLGSTIVYFVSKLMFSRNPELSNFQILNQVFIFVLLYFLFRVFIGIDQKLEQIPKGLYRLIAAIANITLEIYIVQYVIIEVLRPHFGFPLNWMIITVAIIVLATVLHYVCQMIYSMTEKLVEILKK